MGIPVVEYLRCLGRDLNEAEGFMLEGFNVSFTHIFKPQMTWKQGGPQLPLH
jgi:hypothetical protein